jgi:CDP-diacylglycerol---serine O-phosphatidyltransferase
MKRVSQMLGHPLFFILQAPVANLFLLYICFCSTMKLKNHIPNFITLLNLLSGSIAIIMVFSGELTCASWFILIAAFFDFCDGMAARLLNARSPIGAELDSLADVISFGLAPAAIVYSLMAGCNNLPLIEAGGLALLPFIALLLAPFAALRLAKFNTDPGQADEFKGLPTPATGLFIAALPLMQSYKAMIIVPESLFTDFYILAVIVILLSWLMVSSIPMMSLKFKNLSLKDNSYRFILIGAVPFLFLFFGFAAVPAAILLYILLSFISLSKI